MKSDDFAKQLAQVLAPAFETAFQLTIKHCSQDTQELLAQVSAKLAVPEEPFTGTEEIARLFGVSRSHVEALITETDIPHVRIGTSIRFNKAEVIQWGKDQAASKKAQKAKNKTAPQRLRAVKSARP